MKSTWASKSAAKQGSHGGSAESSKITVRVRKDFAQLSESDISMVSVNRDVMWNETEVQTEVHAGPRVRGLDRPALSPV